MSSFPAIPIRGPQDLNQPFFVCCYSTSQKVVYLLSVFNYTGEDSQPISEVILNPCFSGNFTYPYISTAPDQEGQQYFMVYAYNNGISSPPTSGITSFLPNYSNLSTPLPVTSVVPFVGVYSLPPNGLNASGMSIKQYNPGTASVSNYISLQLPPTSQSPKQYLCRSVLTNDISSALVFSIGGANNFFVKNNNVYSGYPYKIAANGLPSNTTTPFRNLNGYTAFNGATPDQPYRMTTYNRKDRDPAPPEYYIGNTDHGDNRLYPLLGTLIIGGTDVVPTFQGQSISSTAPQTANFDNVKNLDYGDLTYFFVPVTYYPSNFTLNGVTPGVRDEQCSLITSSSTPDITLVLNYLYYAWASGYPPPQGTITDKYVYPIVDQPPGFIKIGNGNLNLAGWSNLADCKREYFYDYCGASDYCGTCYGSCSNTNNKPFCDDNLNFTQFTNGSGLKPFECEATATPKNPLNWTVIFLLSGIGLVILLVFAIVIVALAAKKRSTPRDNILSQIQNSNDTTIVNS